MSNLPITALYIALMVVYFVPLFALANQIFTDPEGRLNVLVGTVMLAGITTGITMSLLGRRFPAIRRYLDRNS